MKRLFAIPLVGVMLTALAVPALATDTLTKPETGTSFEVLGQYRESATSETVYSVDIEWGSMKATYTKYNASTRWNPTTHKYDSAGSSGYGVWEWDTSSNGLDGNEIKITNHSDPGVACILSFLASEDFSGTGSFEGTDEDGKLTLWPGSSSIGDPTDLRLTKRTHLTLTGNVPSSYSEHQSLGTVSITISSLG